MIIKTHLGSFERGVEQSIEKGIEEGQKQAKIEIAKNLLDLLYNETISLKTGLIIDEIEKLRK